MYCLSDFKTESGYPSHYYFDKSQSYIIEQTRPVNAEQSIFIGKTINPRNETVQIRKKQGARYMTFGITAFTQTAAKLSS